MSHEYAMSRVRDALDKSDGNHLKAQRLILGWIEKDHTLLFGLVMPHLQGIISHAVNHVAAPPPKKKAAPAARRIDPVSESSEFGAALLQGLKDGSATFGEPTPRGVSKPGKASQKHVDAIRQLAAAKSKTSGKGGKKK
jgi:hypothetical protein